MYERIQVCPCTIQILLSSSCATDRQHCLNCVNITCDDDFIQETLIVWSEGDNCDYALSFQEKKGCDEVWEKICLVVNSLLPFLAFVDSVTYEYSLLKNNWSHVLEF